jgi:hypothetical protein
MKSMLGDKHPNWKGITMDSKGYVLIYRPDHPFATNRSYVYEHRLIWELYNNAVLLPWSDVHHIDGDRQNNSIDNLEAMTHSHHMSLENELRKNAT